jgi:hypothetical protein
MNAMTRKKNRNPMRGKNGKPQPHPCQPTATGTVATAPEASVAMVVLTPTAKPMPPAMSAMRRARITPSHPGVRIE